MGPYTECLHQTQCPSLFIYTTFTFIAIQWHNLHIQLLFNFHNMFKLNQSNKLWDMVSIMKRKIVTWTFTFIWTWQLISASKMVKQNERRFGSTNSPLDCLVEHEEGGMLLIVVHQSLRQSKLARVYIFQCTKYCHHILE
jgi:hypothetical protein